MLLYKLFVAIGLQNSKIKSTVKIFFSAYRLIA